MELLQWRLVVETVISRSFCRKWALNKSFHIKCILPSQRRQTVFLQRTGWSASHQQTIQTTPWLWAEQEVWLLPRCPVDTVRHTAPVTQLPLDFSMQAVCLVVYLEEEGLQLPTVFPTVLLGEDHSVRWDAVVRHPAVALQHPDHDVRKTVLRLNDRRRGMVHCCFFNHVSNWTLVQITQPSAADPQSQPIITSSTIVLSLLAQSSACSNTVESSVASPCLRASAAATICCRCKVRMCLKLRSRGFAHCQCSREGSSSLEKEETRSSRGSV